MATTTNRTQQLVEAHKHGRFGQKASLQAAGVELPQHNVKTTKKAAKKTAKKSTAKKTSAAKTKTTAKKTAVKATAKKS